MSLYTRRKVPGLDCKIKLQFDYQEPRGDTTRELKYEIAIQPTGEIEIDVDALLNYCQSEKASSLNQPLRAIQAIDIVLKYGTKDRHVSFFYHFTIFSFWN